MIVYDHRGVGASTRLEGAITIGELAADAAGLLAALELDSAHVLGISMGGMIAQELALADPELMRTLTLGCTYCGGPGSALHRRPRCRAGSARRRSPATASARCAPPGRSTSRRLRRRRGGLRALPSRSPSSAASRSPVIDGSRRARSPRTTPRAPRRDRAADARRSTAPPISCCRSPTAALIAALIPGSRARDPRRRRPPVLLGAPAALAPSCCARTPPCMPDARSR